MKKRWTQELIESETRLVIQTVGHFPTGNRLVEMGKHDLANAIARYAGGFTNLAKAMGMERRLCTSAFGWAGEEAVAAELRRRGFTATRTEGTQAPYDILVNGAVRIDVKNARFADYATSKQGYGRGWYYHLGKHVQADLVALHQHDDGGTYIIPWNIIPASSITVTRGGGKYSRYKDAWWIVERLCAHLNEFNADISAQVNGEAALSHG